MNKIELLWSNLRASFWFLPLLIVTFSVVLAVGLIEVDSSGSRDWMAAWPRLFGAGAAGARGMLVTIAGSMTTVLGVTFSMTLVALALASSQYTSRVLRNFMSDRVTQVVLGIFAGIFSYCLIVLRTIRGGDEGGFVPSLSVAISVALAIGGIGTLIFFIHHIASSIQASSIIASVATETLKAVDRLFPGKLGHGPMEDNAPPNLHPHPQREWQVIRVHENGYIQSVDNAALLRVARGQKAIVRMERGVGEFVVDGTPLVSLAQDDKLDEDIIAKLTAAFGIDRHRTVEQDAAFGIRQIVDIALRALSPGINDSTTAAMCLDYLTAILARVASLPIPSSHRFEDGELRVIAIGPDFASFVAGSFDEIRGSAAGNLAIMLRMLDALQTIGSLTDDAGRRHILREQVICIAEVGPSSIPSTHDRARFEERLASVSMSLSDEQVPAPHNQSK